MVGVNPFPTRQPNDSFQATPSNQYETLQPQHARNRIPSRPLAGEPARGPQGPVDKRVAVGGDVSEFKALSEGGQIRMPIQETFWARRFGMFVDRFGTPWMVNCEKRQSMGKAA